MDIRSTKRFLNNSMSKSYVQRARGGKKDKKTMETRKR